MVKLDEILEREVTRRQFLMLLGAGLMGILGISTLLGIFSQDQPEQRAQLGYGLRDYGP
jgi:hypothetical protein